MDATVLRSLVVAVAVLISSLSPPHKSSTTPSSTCPFIDCPPCTLSCSCPPAPEAKCPAAYWEEPSSPLLLGAVLGLVVLAFLLGWQCRQTSQVVIGRPVRSVAVTSAPAAQQTPEVPPAAADLAQAARTQVASLKKELGL